MKKLLALALIGISSSAFACLGEAQLIAKIAKVEKIAGETCLAYIDTNTVQFYSPNRFCPLDLVEIANEGIVTGFYGDQCDAVAGDTINGIVVRTESGIKLD
jgi:hypothetical protein